MRPPLVADQPVPVLRAEQLRAVLEVCAGRGFTDRRDTAAVLLFVDTGMRLSELAGLAVHDVDLDLDVAVVLGEGRQLRSVLFGRRAAQAVVRYLRVRARHARADSPALWLGERSKGPMTADGIATMVRRRGRQAGLDGLHPHAFRHTFAQDAGYIADIPDLESCSAFGATPQDALIEVLRAKEAWLSAAREPGIPIPERATVRRCRPEPAP
ncbi:MAG: tyrosine-type recombinase/integrase [Egibacteraceae bacterium]